MRDVRRGRRLFTEKTASFSFTRVSRKSHILRGYGDYIASKYKVHLTMPSVNSSAPNICCTRISPYFHSPIVFIVFFRQMLLHASSSSSFGRTLKVGPLLDGRG